jgi:hypothetical protein
MFVMQTIVHEKYSSQLGGFSSFNAAHFIHGHFNDYRSHKKFIHSRSAMKQCIRDCVPAYGRMQGK